jgi:hypothetical protein
MKGKKKMTVVKKSVTTIDTTISDNHITFTTEDEDNITVYFGDFEIPLKFIELMNFMREVNKYKLSCETGPLNE